MAPKVPFRTLEELLLDRCWTGTDLAPAATAATLFSMSDACLSPGVAEHLCGHFRLPVPAWVEKPEFFLAEEWDFASEIFVGSRMLLDMTPYWEERRAKSDAAFLRRNVIFEPRALITP
jgi:hypothetical protein